MQDANLLVQQFGVATTEQEALDIASNMELIEEPGTGPDFVIKAMVHAGGRGKGVFTNGFKGGVHLADTPAEAAGIAGKMLGNNLVTKQTGDDGVRVDKVMIAEALDIDEEKYFAILLDREYNGPVMIASPQGGMDIEAVAEETPDAIMYKAVDINTGLTQEALDEVTHFLEFKDEATRVSAAGEIEKLYDMFLQLDATQVEINPLGTLESGKALCFDAKMNFDESAAFRQKKVFDMHDPSEDDPREAAAAKHDLSYVAMDGNIACMVNGAGLAMATMDIIHMYGGEPANFLDVGGGVTAEKVAEAFKILTGDEKVEGILVNVMGGIVRCDVIAEGVVTAAKEVGLDVPLVVRLSGTNSEEGLKIIAESGLDAVTAVDLDDAAEKAVGMLK